MSVVITLQAGRKSARHSPKGMRVACMVGCKVADSSLNEYHLCEDECVASKTVPPDQADGTIGSSDAYKEACRVADERIEEF